MRLFAALPLSSVAMERLTSLRLRLSLPRDGLRWSAPEQWHITLQFYGEVADATLSCLGDALRRVQSPAPEVHIEELGLFPAKGILYASVQPGAGLIELQREVARASETCGLVPESRPFRPHITLARSRGKEGQRTLRHLSQPALPSFGAAISWEAEELLLIESHLTPHGSEYTERDRIVLGPGASTEVR